MAIQKKKVQTKQLPPAKVKAQIRVTTPSKIVPQGKVVMTNADVKQLMLNYQELKKENAELKKQVEMFEKTFSNLKVEVDEKFGDDENHTVIPTADQLKGYREVDSTGGKSRAEIREDDSLMDDDDIGGDDGRDEDDEEGNEW